ncbi:MAG: hypothetical protein B7Z33_10175 [Sphingomonadales bacterium 12-68-11]|nr:MAG: hypothetical protein B7Z33_10175 [Sphingomonadales bacterium 12-68-11]
MGGATIQERFLQFYPRLRERLARRLGSLDAADDALQETFLKLARVPGSAAIGNAQAYLFRVAVNAATDQQRAGARLASAAEIEAAMAVADPLPDAVRTLEGLAALERLKQAVATLTPRRRAILDAVRLQGRSCREVAAELGLSTRTVELELRHALEHCGEYMRKSGFDYAFHSRDSSIQ